MIRLAASYNVARMLERRHFRERFDAGQPISIHEFLYPLAQAYDSVFLKADVELGGTDQLFNLNVGRDIMPHYGLEPQVVMTTSLLEGTDGVEKMSKSLGNYIGISEPPYEIYAKVLSISDELMWKYYLLLTDLSAAQIESEKAKGDPLGSKKALARRIVADFHGAAAATAAEDEWRRQRQEGQLPTDVPERVLAPGSYKLHQLLAGLGLCASSSEGVRLVRQGAVRLDGEPVDAAIVVESGPEGLTVVGKSGERTGKPSLVISVGPKRNVRAVLAPK
jgi:tyrosyl-tRNA synthetase